MAPHWPEPFMSCLCPLLRADQFTQMVRERESVRGGTCRQLTTPLGWSRRFGGSEGFVENHYLAIRVTSRYLKRGTPFKRMRDANIPDH